MKRSRDPRTSLFGAVLAAIMILGVVVAPAAHAAPSIASVGDVTVTEGNSGSTLATFTVTLSESNGTTTVTYTTVNGTATSGSDYTATSGTLTFGPGETTKTVSVPVTGDLLDEADENFTFALTTINNGTFQGGDPNAVGTILDDDATPTLSITDATVTEGNTDTVTTTVTVTLSAASGRTVSVDFATADGTATFSPGADYHSQSGRLVFNPGETAKTITLTVVSDTTDEPDETFLVNLSNPANATIADGQSTITITDDDAPGQGGGGGGATPAISVSDAIVTEGNGGTVQTTVTVTLSRTSTSFVGVDFTTADNTATFSGSDYYSQSGRLVFAPGETTKTITLTIVGDTVDENNESFFINFSDPTNATLAEIQSVVTITDDDTTTTQPPPPSGAQPSITVSDASVAEGSNGDTNVAITVSLSSSSTSNVTIDFATTDGSATFAGSDYWRMSGRLVFAPGETSRTLTATVVGDVVDESNEVFYIDLSNPTNAILSDARSAITIIDDDGGSATPPPGGGTPTISISDATVQEGNAETTTATLTLTLSTASSNPVSVDIATADGTASFDAGDYYETRGRLVFQPGETTETLQITVNGDTLAEGDEVFYVDLTNAVNATIADPRSIITITDDDAPDTTTTTMTVVKKPGRLVAKGTVVPPHPGDRMRVILKKRRNGRFRTLDVNRPLLGDALDRDGDGVFESNYRTTFKRPRRGLCLMKAVFAGDADHLKSVSKGRFRC